jgi:hypothetical protein
MPLSTVLIVFGSWLLLAVLTAAWLLLARDRSGEDR